MEASGAYRYFYESLMKAVTINSGNVSILPGLYENISDYYEQLERILHPVDNDYRAKQYRELPEEQKEAILRMEENETHAWIVQKRDKNKDNSLFNNQCDKSATEKSKHLY